MKVARALLSVHDKAGVVDLARALAGFGVEILSTGGTARLLRESGVTVREVADVTGFPEMLDGRVKTLHPRIHGGILARRDRPEHMAALRQHGIDPIDLVVSGLYPFEATVARRGVSREEAIEQIDIGGPALIRAAAKNHAGVAVVTHPSQYAFVLAELGATGGRLGEGTRVRLAQEAFRRTAEYDTAIAAFLAADGEAPTFPDPLRVDANRVTTLRYGENPHQSAAFYREAGDGPWGLATLQQLHGPELSYNNLLDFSAALALLVELEAPAAVVIKHTNPCGVALGSTVGEAMLKAKASDPVSIYGGIVGVNRPLDMSVVEVLTGIFVEILFAPAYTDEALRELRRTKKKARLFQLACDATQWPARRVELRSVLGGLLAQTADQRPVNEPPLKTVTRREPTADELAALALAWRVAKHAKSNAIVLARRDQIVGVGAGQMNRVDAARLAVLRAREVSLATEGAVCASDAFFPFRDALDVVAQAGATAVIHPGGSLRDDEVIAAADEHRMAMVLTGIRHFRH
ncbi:MAG: bifunctional phosphoribosylaminoimidazolecarboxamide formyltransferase/IMP cyclohydrolase [Candidatus Rokuibacteriota bacterium]